MKMTTRRIRHGVLACIMAVSLTAITACTAQDAPSAPSSPPSSAASASTAESATGESAVPAFDGTPIQITIGDTVMQGRLTSSPMAEDLLQRLPMTATFTDHPDGGGFPAKVTHMDPALPSEGTDLGAAPGPGHIGYYVPSGNLGLYYGQLEYWDGAVILGEFEGDTTVIADQDQPFTVTIEVAN